MQRLLLTLTIFFLAVIGLITPNGGVRAEGEGEACPRGNECDESVCADPAIGCFCFALANDAGPTCHANLTDGEVCPPLAPNPCQRGLICTPGADGRATCERGGVGGGGADLGGACARSFDCSGGQCRGLFACICVEATCVLNPEAPAGPAGAAHCSCARAEVEEGACADIGTRLAGLGFRCSRDAEGTCVCQNTNYQQGESACESTSPQLTCIWNPGEAQPSLIPRLVNPLGVGMTFQHLIGRVIKAVLGISGSLALAIFVWGGFTWLTSGGSPDKIDKGKRMLVWATLGLALIFGAYAITNFVIEAVTGATGA